MFEPLAGIFRQELVGLWHVFLFKMMVAIYIYHLTDSPLLPLNFVHLNLIYRYNEDKSTQNISYFSWKRLIFCEMKK